MFYFTFSLFEIEWSSLAKIMVFFERRNEGRGFSSHFIFEENELDGVCGGGVGEAKVVDSFCLS